MAPILAEGIFHSFSVWGAVSNYKEKAVMYLGWTNGLIFGSAVSVSPRPECVKRFVDCIEKMKTSESVGLIDKRYEDHKETWGSPLSEQFAKALTAPGTPIP